MGLGSVVGRQGKAEGGVVFLQTYTCSGIPKVNFFFFEHATNLEEHDQYGPTLYRTCTNLWDPGIGVVYCGGDLGIFRWWPSAGVIRGCQRSIAFHCRVFFRSALNRFIE